MTYQYQCGNEGCRNIVEIEMGMNDEHPKTVKCQKCGGKAFRKFGTAIHLPESFKAMGDSAPWDNSYGKFPKGTKGKYF